MRKCQSDSELVLSRTSGSDVIIFLEGFLEQLSELEKCNIQLRLFFYPPPPPFECDSQIT